MDQETVGSAQRLLEHMGVDNVDQAIEEWNGMKERNEELVDKNKALNALIDFVIEEEDVESLPGLMRKLDKERQRIAAERKVWKNTKKSLEESIELLETEVLKGRDSRGKKAGRGHTFEDSEADSSDNSGCESVHSGASSRRRGHTRDKKRKRAVRNLPKMEKYNGKKEDWERFYDGFMLRFGDVDDDIAITMLAETVTDKAAETFEGIPRKVKNAGLRDVMKWMKERLSEETPFEAIENEKRLRRIEVQGQKISTVCDELERLTRKLQGDKKKREETRRNHLVLLYEGKEQHEKMLDMYANGESYGRMKAKLIQMEYRRDQMDELKMNSQRSEGEDEVQGEKSVICHRCFKEGHMRRDCNVKMEGRDSRMCDHCGKQGHIKEKCYKLIGWPGEHQFDQNDAGFKSEDVRNTLKGPGLVQRIQEGRNGMTLQRPSGLVQRVLGADTGVIQRIQGVSGTDLQRPGCLVQTVLGEEREILQRPGGLVQKNQGWSTGMDLQRPGCLVQRVLGEDTGVIQRIEGRSEDRNLDDLFRIKKSGEEEVKINGHVRRVLLDTGAEASLIEEDLLNGIPGVVIEKKGRTILMDANGKEIKLRGRTVLDVELHIGRKAKIGFHVTRSRVGVIIGGEGLDAIGLELRAVEEPVAGCILPRTHTQEMHNDEREGRTGSGADSDMLERRWERGNEGCLPFVVRLSHKATAEEDKKLAITNNDATTSGSHEVISTVYIIPKVEKKYKKEDFYDIVMNKKCHVKIKCFIGYETHIAKKCPEDIRSVAGCTIDEKKEKKKPNEMFELRMKGGESRDGDASCWKERGDVRETEEIMKKARKKS